MADSPITVELDGFLEDSRNLQNRHYPEMVARAFRDLAKKSRNAVRGEAESKFELRTKFIPNSVLSVPYTSAQIKATAKAIRKHGDLSAAVFLRPARAPKRDLGFMIPHETGGDKVPHQGNVSVGIPAQDLDNYSGAKTSTGATANRWSIPHLLKEYNDVGGKVGGNVKGYKQKGRKRGRVGIPFLKKSPLSGVVQVVRRKNKSPDSLETLYSLKSKAQIDQRWGFESMVWATVRNHYNSILARYLKRMGR